MPVVLRAGRIEQIGSPFELYNDPDNLFVAGFIGSPKMNILPVRFDAGSLVIGDQRIPFTAEEGFALSGQLQLGIRPEHLRPTRDGEPGIELTIDFTEFLGGATYLYGHLGPELPLVVQGAPGPAPAVGQSITVGFDPTNARFFDTDGVRLRDSRI